MPEKRVLCSSCDIYCQVLVETDAGLTGVGEAGLQRRWHAIDGTVKHLRQWLVGEDPSRIEHLWQRMWRGGFYPADRLIGSAISAMASPRSIPQSPIASLMCGMPSFQTK